MSGHTGMSGHAGMPGHARMSGHHAVAGHGGRQGRHAAGYHGGGSESYVALRPGHPDFVPKLPNDYGYQVQQGPPGPAAPSYAYPYYTTRGPRDFLLNNPPSIGR